MRFFKPTELFWQWLVRFGPETIIIDLGCGDGDLVREMGQRGLCAMGIDPRFSLFNEDIPNDLIDRILPFDAETAKGALAAADVILCCRPCHNGFPGEAVEWKSPESDFYYIGFEKNLAIDIGRNHKIVFLMKDAGEDGEWLFHIEPKEQDQ